MTGDPIILDRIGRRYAVPGADAVCALDDVSLDIAGGTSLAITGPSGCGKSTLLGLLAGLEPPSSGRIWIGGVDIATLSDAESARLRREQLGLVFQADNLLPFLTAVENVALQVALGGGDSQPPLELLSELHLADHAHKLPDQLSGGQRQRVSIAAALVKAPRLILADEPTGSLDARSSGGVVDLLLDAQRKSGATLIVVTHDADVAARMDRVIRLHDGRLAGEAGPIAPAETGDLRV